MAPTVLELGCGKAEKTRLLAETGRGRQHPGAEVDTIQHERNLEIADLPNVQFRHGGAEAIPADDNSIDIVLMFVAAPCSDGIHGPGADEIARVLKPGGLAWISEPVYAGELNEVFRLSTTKRWCAKLPSPPSARRSDGPLDARGAVLQHPQFFENFEQFDQRMIQVTHTSHHQLAPELYAGPGKIRVLSRAGGATFLNPQRVDLLRKPA